MSSDSLAIGKTEYQAGKAAFESGQYRQSVQHLERASALVARNTRLGGEIRIWLVTAYEAAGQTGDAIALCKQLSHHPDPETNKQGRRLLYILEAPQLKRPAEWLSQIPDLGSLPDNETKIRLGGGTPSRNRSPKEPQPPSSDLTQVNTNDNQFIWAALIGVGLILGILSFFIVY